MKKFLHCIYDIIFTIVPTFINSLRCGIRYSPTNRIVGYPIIVRDIPGTKILNLLGIRKPTGTIVVGKNFTCLNKFESNSIGCFQRCLFNISMPNSKIIIGDNVGISGSSINATNKITIGNNVLIGAGCIITDTDHHPINWEDRINNNNKKTKCSPIVIEDNVFIGARSIILKGVTIGKCAIVGAGSVVCHDVPPYSIVGGNPAKVIRFISNQPT